MLNRLQMMAGAAGALIMLALTPVHADEPFKIELNATEPMESRCRLTFVLSNPEKNSVDTLRADTAVFGSDGVVKRRLMIEFGPLKPRKTSIRAFDLDFSCDSLGSLLVNDIVACAPGTPGDCLARLELSSRTAIKLFK